jgi:hypothetical protein
MKTLLNAADVEEALRRIHRLTPAAPRQWGKMNAAQMLAHLRVSLQLALGEHAVRRSVIGLLIGRLAKRKMAGPEPFRHDLPTAKSFRITDARDFAIEKANLIAVLQRFQAGGAAGITKAPHPFFGPLTTAEWETLQWKHLDHHLRQFGV